MSEDRDPCGGCQGRGHHPTRHDLECQMCHGTGLEPFPRSWKEEAAIEAAPGKGGNQ